MNLYMYMFYYKNIVRLLFRQQLYENLCKSLEINKSIAYIHACKANHTCKVTWIWQSSAVYNPFSKIRNVLYFFLSFSSSFFSKFKKLSISLIYKAIIICSVNLPMVNIYKFKKKETLIQPPGEPREQHLDLPCLGRASFYWGRRLPLSQIRRLPNLFKLIS